MNVYEDGWGPINDNRIERLYPGYGQNPQLALELKERNAWEYRSENYVLEEDPIILDEEELARQEFQDLFRAAEKENGNLEEGQTRVPLLNKNQWDRVVVIVSLSILSITGVLSRLNFSGPAESQGDRRRPSNTARQNVDDKYTYSPESRLVQQLFSKRGISMEPSPYRDPERPYPVYELLTRQQHDR